MKQTTDLIQEIQECINEYETTGLKPSLKIKMDLYTKVYNVLSEREPTQDAKLELLYEKFVQLLGSNLIVHFPFQEVEQGSLEYMIKGNREYENFYTILYLIFKHMDVVLAQQNDLRLMPTSVNVFYRKVFKRNKNQLVESFSQAFTDYQDDNWRTMNDFLEIVKKMSSFEYTKQDKFLEEIQTKTVATARSLYQNQFQLWLNQGHGTYAFLKILEDFLTSQDQFIGKAFQSCDKLKASLQHEFRVHMIQEYKSTLLETNNPEGFTAMLDSNSQTQTENLKRVYRLYFQLNDQFSLIRQNLKAYLLVVGRKIIEDKVNEALQSNTQLKVSQEDQFINKLFQLHRKYLQIINDCFCEDQYLRQAFKDAFEEILNQKIGDFTFPEYLGQYASQLLESQKITDEQKIDIQHLYSFLSDKDYFIAYYQRQLAVRLLMKKTNKEDELLMVAKLEHISGSGTVKPLFEMITEISNDQVNKDFIQLRTMKDIKFQVDVRVLSKQFWPKFQEFPQKSILKEIADAQIAFDAYYQQLPQNQHRQLTWMNTLSQVVLRYKKYDLHVSMYQQHILYAFQTKNDPKNLDFFIQSTGLEKQYLLENIQALLESNLVLKEGDSYKFNEHFSSKSLKVEVKWLISYKDLEQRTLDNEREQIIEAALIKIMKKEKKIHFAQLIQKVQSYLVTFNPSLAQIKEKIEKLFKLEYLSRLNSDHEMITYIG